MKSIVLCGTSYRMTCLTAVVSIPRDPRSVDTSTLVFGNARAGTALFLVLLGAGDEVVTDLEDAEGNAVPVKSARASACFSKSSTSLLKAVASMPLETRYAVNS